MKEKWLTKLIREAKRTKLTHTEKHYMLSAIMGAAKVPSPYYFVMPDFIRNYHRQAVAFVVVFALVLTSTGTSFAAESALPGEALYGIKVNVNEEIKSLVAFSADAKARVGVERTTKRLKEAEELSKQGKLTPEAQVIIKKNIKSHGDDIKKSLKVLASTNSTTTAQEVVTSLKESVASVIADNTDTEATSTDTAIFASFAGEIDVTADAQAIGLTSITDELTAEIVIIQEKLSGTTTAETATPTATTTPPSTSSSTTLDAILRL
jgi:predicted aconitase with swiveling domain